MCLPFCLSVPVRTISTSGAETIGHTTSGPKPMPIRTTPREEWVLYAAPDCPSNLILPFSLFQSSSLLTWDGFAVKSIRRLFVKVKLLCIHRFFRFCGIPLPNTRLFLANRQNVRHERFGKRSDGYLSAKVSMIDNRLQWLKSVANKIDFASLPPDTTNCCILFWCFSCPLTSWCTTPDWAYTGHSFRRWPDIRLCCISHGWLIRVSFIFFLLFLYSFTFIASTGLIALISPTKAAHLWGDRPYNELISPTESKIAIFGTFAFGEGYHNYHHT